MGYARYVGRVGALAVALGVGAAVATTPGVVWAQPDAEDSSATTNEGSADPTGSAPPAAEVPTVADPTDPEPSDDESQSTVTIGESSVSASGGANTTVGSGAVDIEGDEPTEPETPASEPPASAKTGESHESAVSATADVADAVSDATPDLAAPNDESAGGVVQSPLDSSAAPLVDSVAAVDTSVLTAPVEPAKEQNPVTTAAVDVAQLFSSVLSPLLVPTPESPVAPALMWAALAWARRDFEAETTLQTATTTLATTSEVAPEEDAGARMMLMSADEDTLSLAALAPGSVVELGNAGAATTGSPAGVALSSDGSRAYVTNSAAGTVTVINTATGAAIGAPITVGSNPTDAVLNSAGTRLYVANKGSNSVSVIDTSTANPSVVKTISLGAGAAPEHLALSPDGTRLLVSNTGKGTVTKINTSNNAITTTGISVGFSPGGIAFSADGKYAYVASTGSDNVSIIRMSDNQKTTLSGAVDNPTDIVVNAATGRGYITTLAGDVAVFDTASNSIIDHIATGKNATGAALSPDGSILVVANTDDTVTAIDTDTHEILAELQTDPTPAPGTPSVVFHPDGTKVFVTDTEDNALRTVSVGVTITPNNAPVAGTPVINPPNTATGTVTGTVVATDDDGDPLTFSIGNAPAGAAVTIDSETGAFSYTPSVAERLAAGNTTQPTSTFIVTVSDGRESIDVPISVPISAMTLSAAAAAAPTGPNPTGIALSADGSRAFITNRDANSITIIDTASGNTVGSMSSYGINPTGITVNSSGTRLYVANRGSNSVSVINVADGSLVKQINNVGTNPEHVAISPDGSRLLVSNTGSGTVTKINTATNQVTTSGIKVGTNPGGIAFSPDGKYAYVANQGSNDVTIITMSTNAKATLGGVGTSPTNITIDQATGSAYVTTLSGKVTVLDTTTNTVAGTITTGKNATAASLSPDGRILITANTDDTITAINTTTNLVITSVQIDPNPEAGTPSIAYHPNGTRIFVTDGPDNVLRTIDFQLANQPPTPSVTPAATILYTDTDGGTVFELRGTDERYTFGYLHSYFSRFIVIDNATGQVKFLDSTGVPNFLGSSADGRYVYTSVIDDATQSIVVFDITNDTAVTHPLPGVVQFGVYTTVTISADQTHVYALHDGYVSILDLATGVVTDSATPVNYSVYTRLIPLRDDSGVIATSLYGPTALNGLAIVSNSGAVTPYAVVQTTSSGRAPEESPDGRYIYVGGQGSGVTVIDTATGTTRNLVAAHGYAVDYDRGRLLVMTTSSTLTVYNLDGSGGDTHIPLGSSYRNVVVHPGTGTAYVYGNSSSLAIVDPVTRQTTTIPVVRDVNEVQFSEDGERALAFTNRFSDANVRVIVVDPATRTPSAEYGISDYYEAASGNGRYVHWLNYDLQTGLYQLSTLDTASGTVVAARPFWDYVSESATLEGLVFPSDGTQVLFSLSGLETFSTYILSMGLPPREPTADGVTIDPPNPDTGVVTGALSYTDVDGDTLTYSVASPPAHGEVVINSATGVFTYTPPSSTNETTDAFVLQVDDGKGGVVPVSVTVPVLATTSFPGNVLPVVGTPAVGEPNPTDGSVIGTVSATDANGDTLTYTASPTTKGDVQFVGGGNFTYTPTLAARHAAASDTATPEDRHETFLVTVDDGHGVTVSVPVTVEILGYNNDPVSEGYITFAPHIEDGVLTGYIRATDPEDIVRFDVTQQPAKGSVSISQWGEFTYTPTEAARAAASALTATEADTRDVFVVTPYDGHGGVAEPITVTVQVTSYGPSIVSVSTTQTNLPVPLDVTRHVQITSDGSHTYVVTETRSGPSNSWFTTVSILDQNAVLVSELTVPGTSSVNSSPDSDWMIVSTQQGSNPGELIVVDVNGGLTNHGELPGYSGGVVFNADGSQAYITTLPPHSVGTSTVYIIDADGTVTSAELTNQQRAAVQKSPDGSRIYVISGNAPTYGTDVRISRINQDNTLTTVVTASGHEGSLTFSPDGEIAYLTTRTYTGSNTSQTAVWRFNADETISAVVGPKPGAGTLAFGLDGNTAFLTTTISGSGLPATTSVSVIKPDGTIDEIVSNQPGFGSLVLSPSGSRVLLRTYLLNADNSAFEGMSLAAINADYTVTELLTSAHNFDMSFNADGSLVAAVMPNGPSPEDGVVVAVIKPDNTISYSSPIAGVLSSAVLFGSDGGPGYIATETGSTSEPASDDRVYIAAISSDGQVTIAPPIDGRSPRLFVSPDGSRAYVETFITDQGRFISVVKPDGTVMNLPVLRAGIGQLHYVGDDRQHAYLISPTVIDNQVVTQLSVINPDDTIAILATFDGGLPNVIHVNDSTMLLITRSNFSSPLIFTLITTEPLAA